MHTIFKNDASNFFIAEPKGTMMVFLAKIDDLAVMQKTFVLLGFIICDLNFVPLKELKASGSHPDLDLAPLRFVWC